MTDLDKMARELLASACGTTVEGMQLWGSGSVPTLRALRAIRTALLTAPPGWKLVPVEPTEELTLRIAKALQGSEQLGWTWEDCSPIEVEGWMDLANAAISAMLAAAPEVK